MREIYQSMEQGLTLIGATGIEDRLQDKVGVIFSIFKDYTKIADFHFTTGELSFYLSGC